MIAIAPFWYEGELKMYAAKKTNTAKPNVDAIEVVKLRMYLLLASTSSTLFQIVASRQILFSLPS